MHITKEILAGGLAASLSSAASIGARDDYTSPTSNYSSEKDHNLEFDYIIVGGGTGGLAVAARLVETGRFNVAVIEAGGYYEQDNGNFSSTPGLWTVGAGTDPKDPTLFNPLVDWGLITQPMKSIDNRQIHYTRGKTLGGSSARNAMYYHRPTVGAMDQWAKQVGDESYQLSSLLPYFNKAVHHTPPKDFPSNSQDEGAWGGQEGPVLVSHGNYVDPFGLVVQPILAQVGYKPINGFSSGQLIGSGYTGFTVNPVDAHRSSSETSYLASVKNNSRLTVFHNTLAHKILLNEHKKAHGVEVFRENKTHTYKAKHEIILAAGVFQSPQLLLLSGIGPADTLKSHNIDVKVDLPGVGQNLQEHPLFSTGYSVTMPTASYALNNPSVFAAAQEAFNTQATGPLSIPGAGLVGFEKLPSYLRENFTAETKEALAKFPADWPEVEMLPFGGALGYNKNYNKEDPLDGKNYATIATSMVAPLSRGSVTLASANPADAPLIDLNWFSHPADVEVAIASLKRQREIWAAMPKNLTIDEWLPGTKVQSDEQILQFIKDSIAPTWHASATCKMGKKEDRLAVVDAEARVFGTEGLRVVDASAFPFAMPGHPQGTVYALAEKIAEKILNGVAKA